MRKNYGYDAYRGRSPLRGILKWIIALLAAVLVLTVAALLWLQQFMVYSSEGGRLVFPWTEQNTPSASPSAEWESPAVSPTVVVVTPEAPAPEYLHAALLPREALSDGTAEDRLAEAGAQVALFDMKGDDGSLAYVSALDLAVRAGASSADPDRNAAIRELNGREGLYTVARVSCFKDDKLSDADRSLNITTNSGYRWTDPEGLKWSSPTSQTVRQYVAGVCAELAALGFDEILLDNAGYPTQGNLGYIKPGAAYDRAQFSAVIGEFYKEVEEALSDYPEVRLSVATDRDTLEKGKDERSGQTVAALAQSADRLWVRGIGTGWAQCVERLEAVGFEEPEVHLVSVQDEPGAKDRSWVCWP